MNGVVSILDKYTVSRTNINSWEFFELRSLLLILEPDMIFRKNAGQAGVLTRGRYRLLSTGNAGTATVESFNGRLRYV